MVEPAREFGPADRAPWAVTAAYVTGALVLLLGLFPGVITTLAQDSVRFVLG
jgi:hypothetical protein